MGERPSNRTEAAGRRALRERRVETYQRLMEAEERLDHVRRRHGLPESAIADALDAIEGDGPRLEPEDDLYLSTLARYVAELGGHVEVRAVFPQETITLLREPGSGHPRGEPGEGGRGEVPGRSRS